MTIDLTKIPIGISFSERDINRLKSGLIQRSIFNMKEKYNFIIMPISVYNIIENHQKFESCHVDITDNGVFKVGNFCGYDCYVDMMILDNRIILSKDLQSMRDNKINSILGISSLVKDLEIDIIL